MFTADAIQARVRQQPFVPLRITTSAGQMFELHHPDLIMIGRWELMLGTASSKNPTQYEQTTRVAIMHVTALEDLPLASPSTGNGQE